MTIRIAAILTALACSAHAEDTYRIIEVARNATDWSATVSLNGAQPQAITFPPGKRPTDAAILVVARAAEAARKAAAAAEAAAQAVDPTETWSVQRTVAGKLVLTTWPAGTRPTPEEMRKAVAATPGKDGS